QGTTDANGQVSVSLVSTTVGAATLVATLADGTTASVNTLYFVAVPVIYPGEKVSVIDSQPDEDNPTIAVTEYEKILAKVKDILIFLGHDVEAVFDEAVALAKKL
ncbi:hypothetical protein, partial [Martelella alba]|uniref:hypothetical protein n=1 Tax=Martelella alba TaxID=2590451 RepID=UPI001484EA36